MESDDVFVLGALYRKFSYDRYSCAVITRDAHPKMEPYYHKAFPCFLPNNDQFLQRWLGQLVQQHPEINKVLNFPTLYPTIKVQGVKTYKDKVPYQSFSPVILPSDLLVIQSSG
jgi:putative SOS response-associated peptidase YedK